MQLVQGKGDGGYCQCLAYLRSWFYNEWHMYGSFCFYHSFSVSPGMVSTLNQVNRKPSTILRTTMVTGPPEQRLDLGQEDGHPASGLHHSCLSLA